MRWGICLLVLVATLWAFILGVGMVGARIVDVLRLQTLILEPWEGQGARPSLYFDQIAAQIEPNKPFIFWDCRRVTPGYPDPPPDPEATSKGGMHPKPHRR